jgi:hypothetical protein
MPKLIAPVTASVVAAAATLTVTTMTSGATGTSYAEDRAAIEDLQARYLFAMDFGDPDLYVEMFSEDGILDVGSGEIRGRDAASGASTTRTETSGRSRAATTPRGN